MSSASSSSVSMLNIAYLTLFLLIRVYASADSSGFVSDGNFSLGGSAKVNPSGLLSLIDGTPYTIAHAFYPQPFTFKTTSSGNALSFSTHFVIALAAAPGMLFSGDGMAFVISPTKELEGATAKYGGLFNETNNGNSSNHIVAVEFDTFQNDEFDDIDNNHVGIDLNRIESNASAPASYFLNGEFRNFSLASGDPIQAWVDYDGVGKWLSVSSSPIDQAGKPRRPLLSVKIDLSSYVLNEMYVGFASATGALVQSSYVLGWSFQMNGSAPELDLSKLPSLPRPNKSGKKPNLLAILVPVIGTVSILGMILMILFLIRRKSKFAEILEDWEVEYGPHRFSYKELYKATKGFSEKELLGKGGFGQVFHGVLPTTNHIAVKRISHNSSQGTKEFVAEIATIGRIRHPNLVRLLGYCRRMGELYLVYDYMANGSLDMFIFNKEGASLNWNQRFNIIKDVASGLTYLHEEWVEVIIHRDIKASNVLLDGELNGKLGDFGLARFVCPGKEVKTTQIAGTLGYIAPELAMNVKSNTVTDVFAFGVFCLEVACGRRPLDQRAPPAEESLLEWVSECWKEGEILRTADPKLGNEFKVEQMEMVLKLGLLCTQLVAEFRPSMSRIKAFLNGEDASDLENIDDILSRVQNWKDLKDFATSYTWDSEKMRSKASLTISEMFISVGR